MMNEDEETYDNFDPSKDKYEWRHGGNELVRFVNDRDAEEVTIMDEDQQSPSPLGRFFIPHDEKGKSASPGRRFKFSKIKTSNTMEFELENRLRNAERSLVKRLRALLQSHKFHVFVIVMVVIDCVSISAELLIDYFDLVTSDHGDKMNENALTTESIDSDFDVVSSTKPISTHVVFVRTLFDVLENFFKYVSLLVSTVFLFEIILKLALMPKQFLKFMEIFDAIVVIAGFTVNILLLNKKHSIHSISGLITALRLWRIIELLNSVVQAVELKHEEQTKNLNEKIKMLEFDNRLLTRQLQVQRNKEHEQQLLQNKLQRSLQYQLEKQAKHQDNVASSTQTT